MNKEKLLKKLIKHNFLGLKNFYADKLAERKLTRIILDIASACNAKCPFCPRQEEGHPFKNNDIMSEEVFNTVFKQLKRMPEVNKISLYAFGEPLLNKNAGKFIQKLKTLEGRKLTLSTNSTNMENFTQDLMLLDYLQYSVEGWDKESYEKSRVNLKFEETVEKIKNFSDKVKKRRENGLHTPEVRIHCLYTKKTDLDAFVKVWSPYVDVLRFTPLGTYIVWENGEPKQYQFNVMEDEIFNYNEKKDKISLCCYIKNGLTLNAAGKVVLCCADFYQNLDLGDYRDLKRAFNNRFFKEIARKMILNESNYCDACINNFKRPEQEIEQFQPNRERLKQYENEGLVIKSI